MRATLWACAACRWPVSIYSTIRLNGGPYHERCLPPASHAALMEDRIRQIVREELERLGEKAQ